MCYQYRILFIANMFNSGGKSIWITAENIIHFRDISNPERMKRFFVAGWSLYLYLDFCDDHHLPDKKRDSNVLVWASPIKTLAKDLGKKEGFQNFHSLHLLVHYVEGGKILAQNFGPWPQTNLALQFWIPLSLMNTIMNELYVLCLVICYAWNMYLWNLSFGRARNRGVNQ